jgi:formate/nitrite transporter FocA (FNT family)
MSADTSFNSPEKEKEESAVDLSETEEHDVEQHVAQRAPVIFEIVRRQGEEELSRPVLSLWWSGIAAGLSMGFSALVPAFLHASLPSGQTWELVERLGYSVGFVLVILAHQQLFTENTITAVVPLFAHMHLKNFGKLARLWSIVLVANVIGTTLFAAFFHSSGVLDPGTQEALRSLSIRLFEDTASQTFSGGICAGFIIASLVWVLANLEDSKFVTIVLMTYLIALGHFAHVIAGSAEAAYAVIDRAVTLKAALNQFFIPALLGNVVGGTALFALLMYGQTHQELKDQAENAG